MFPRPLTAGAVLAVVFASQPVTAQPQPSEQHKRLQFFVGDWKIEGEEKASPSGPAAKSTATEHCEWFEGHFHVLCRADVTEPGRKSKELVVLGYDSEAAVYTRYNIGSDGQGALATARLEGKMWQWQGGAKGMQVRFPWTETSADSYDFEVEMSNDGKPFTQVLRGKATRVK